MPFFKTTHNILTKQDEDEAFNPNWMNSDQLILPPKKDWDYNREMQIEDVNLWEVLCEESAGRGVYVSWDPYAEFYLITTGFDFKNNFKWIQNRPYQGRIFETYYGPMAQNKVLARTKELNIGPIMINKIWVDDDKMWLYQKPENKIISNI
jgi:hypothetical protein